MRTKLPLSVSEARAARGALTELLCSTAGDPNDAEVGSERTVVERLIVRLDRGLGHAIQWAPGLG